MTQKWNLQDIRPAETRQPRRVVTKETTKKVITRTNSANPEEDPDTIVIKDNNKKKRFNYTAVIVLVVFLFGGIFGLSAFLSKTTLTVTPEFREPNVNAEFIAYPKRNDASVLSYEIMTLEDEGERQVTATGQTHAEEQARGHIEIIKTTAGSERLIKNTRFRSKDGLIFRIQESVVVPGAMKDSGGNLVPGTIRAEVFADATGPEYNLPSGSRFDVPAFQENNLTELHNSIYAENFDSFTGGFNGPRFTIDENELATAKQSLQMELRDKLLARVNSERPADFVAFTDSVSITYHEQPSSRYGDNLVTIKEKAVLRLPLFKHNDFASYLARETITTYNNRDLVRIRNVDGLTFSYVDSSNSNENIADMTSLSFQLTGKPLIVWEYDAEQLKEDLAGKSMTAIHTVLSAHPGIKNAIISGKPFWKTSFPTDPNKIIVVENLNNQ